MLHSPDSYSGLSGGWCSSVGDSSEAHSDRKTPGYARQPGRAAGELWLYWKLDLRFVLNFGLSASFQHISSTLSSLSAAWAIDLDSFHSPTPRGQVKFTNIIATLDPSAPRRLLLACHYDSKALPPDPRAPERVFLGASDSGVPCAMILELAASLDIKLRDLKKQVWFLLCSF